MTGRMLSMRFLIPAALIVAVLQSAILLYAVTSRAAVLRDGAEVRLETAPIDPRDFLRGDYVILNYKIGEVSPEFVTGSWPTDSGRHTIHVRLEPEATGFWTVREASFAPLPEKPGSVVAEGITDRFSVLGSGRAISVAYGIERYYVPEGEGKAIEAARNDGRISIAARVSKSGIVHIRALLEDGRPLYEEPLY